MRKAHIFMFGSHALLIVALAVYLFYGLGEEFLMAFIFPVFTVIYILADMAFTTFTTDYIAYRIQNNAWRFLLVLQRDVFVVLLWSYLLTFLETRLILVAGIICYAVPKLLKLIVFDIIGKQKYLDVKPKI